MGRFYSKETVKVSVCAESCNSEEDNREEVVIKKQGPYLFVCSFIIV